MNVVTLERIVVLMVSSHTNLSVGRVFGCSLGVYERTPFHLGPNTPVYLG